MKRSNIVRKQANRRCWKKPACWRLQISVKSLSCESLDWCDAVCWQSINWACKEFKAAITRGLRTDDNKVKDTCFKQVGECDTRIALLFPLSLSISYIKNCLILSLNVKYGTFVTDITKTLSYALWENNSGSNSLWESSASCAGLSWGTK